MRPGSSGTLCSSSKRNFLEGMVGARRNPGSSQDSSDGTSSAAVSGPYNFAGS